MRRVLVAIHVVALGLWLGALAFSFLEAKALFDLARPICPACARTLATAGPGLLSCEGCGALHHEACARAGCALEHRGSHALSSAAPVTSAALLGTAQWTRVLVTRVDLPPERRLLWRLDAASAAQSPERGEVPGACFELPWAAVGDALARVFVLASALGVAMGILALGTVLLTPPGGAARAIRALVLAGAFGLACWGLALDRDMAARRLPLEDPAGASAEARSDFGKHHGMAFGLNTLQGLLVLVGLVLARERRPSP